MTSFDDVAALTAYKDWTGAINTLWTIFSAAAVGFATLAAKVERRPGWLTIRAGLGSGWVFFVAGNAWALYRAQEFLYAITSALQNRATAKDVDVAYKSVFLATRATDPWNVVAFQLVLSAFVLGVILFASEKK